MLDLKQTAPDLILHGGDLAHGSSSPSAAIDRIRDLGWRGVLGNTDEMLFDLAPLRAFASETPQMQPLLATIERMAGATAEALGEEQLAWLRAQPLKRIHGQMTLVHASPSNLWRAPIPEASASDLADTYEPLGSSMAVYAHIHCSYIRTRPSLTVANTGSVSLSHDGDPRSAYLLLDDGAPRVRRVEYEVEKELRALKESGFPHTEWRAKILLAARSQLP